MLGSAESEHPRLTKSEIIFEDFHPIMWSRYLNVTDEQADRQTDGRTICRSISALCVASRGKNLKNTKKILQTTAMLFVSYFDVCYKTCCLFCLLFVYM